MADLNHKKSDIQEMNQPYEIKRCSDCGTSKTPLWRGGPAGPKSLCNACGIRSRKKRRAILGEEKKGRKKSATLHQRLVELGMVERSRVENRRKFGEEEEAALLLMALSYGSVYA